MKHRKLEHQLFTVFSLKLLSMLHAFYKFQPIVGMKFLKKINDNNFLFKKMKVQISLRHHIFC